MKYNKKMFINHLRAALASGTTLCLIPVVFMGMSSSAHAASCCGGGSASSLVLPKFAEGMIDISMDYEHYTGIWDNDGDWNSEPNDLNQYRINLGYAHRLAPNWQASVTLPYVFNRNKYPTLERNTSGMGDGTISVWYEAFEKITCVWDVKKWEDLMPAVYLGGTLTVPTGISPYDDVADNFDITGRGAYRLDASMLIDKTIYPWNMSFGASYGKYLERPINQEYGTNVEPYRKQLGDRFNTNLSFGYTYFTDEMDSITGTLAYAILKEDEAIIDGTVDTTSGFRKETISATLAWASENRDWVYKLTFNHSPTSDDWGENFATTNVITVGVSHVLR
ncbi:MAG: hypothetical protein OQK32_08965 [Gammaproteobacteria bacterium]|nr:hypothetical protein [Gammaproteobacteria bacterium]MCW8922546.1 hypothetical protein [Gammaproteobacteria bacterium]